MKPYIYITPLPSFKYYRPNTLNEALNLLNEYESDAKILAGGTDLLISLKNWDICPKAIIDISNLKEELKYIKNMDDQIEIGALITHSEVMNSIILKKFAECLIEACSQVGTWQIRNLGTIGGNLVNASPAADTAPCFLVLGAKVRLRSINNVREIKIEDFFTGVKKSVIRPDEILVSVIFPRHARSTSAWARIGRRNANTLSIASVASLVSIKDGIFEEAKIAMGAVAPTPILARNASNFLKNKEVNRKNIIEAAEMAAEEAKPITDVRASAWYRREMIKVLAQKTLLSAISRSGVSLDG